MLALRPLIALLALVFIPAIAAYVWLRTELDANLKYAIIALLAFAGLSMLRRSVLQPLRVVAKWRRFAAQNQYEFFGSLSHEPFLRGLSQGRRFVAGVSAHRVETGEGRYRTLVSAPVDAELPAGLRVYSRHADFWLNDYSENANVATGDETLETELRCEGTDFEDVRRYVTDPEHRAMLLAFANDYPGMLLHGAVSDEMPAEPGGSRGVIMIAIPGRISDLERLTKYVNDVCEFATRIDAAGAT